MLLEFTNLKNVVKSWWGVSLATLLFAPLTTLTGCHSERLADLTPEEKREDTTHTPKGVRVVLEMEDTSTGTTRTITGDHDYSFTELGKGGTVQVQAKKFYKANSELRCRPMFKLYAQKDVVFLGWSWRYAEDPKGTHRDIDGKIISNYISAPTLQSEEGVNRIFLPGGVPRFYCYYQDGKKNVVYVKVKYIVVPNVRTFPEMVDFSKDEEVYNYYLRPQHGSISYDELISSNRNIHSEAKHKYFMSFDGNANNTGEAIEVYGKFLYRYQSLCQTLASRAYDTYLNYDDETIRLEPYVDNMNDQDRRRYEDYVRRKEEAYEEYLALSQSAFYECKIKWDKYWE